MAEESFQEKTEQPSPRKRREARERGEVAKSRELASVAVLLSGLVVLSFTGSYTYSHVQDIMRETFALPLLGDLNIAEFNNFAYGIVAQFIKALLPLLAGIFITAILANVLQVGFLVSVKAIAPKLSKIDPIKGFKRLFSIQSVMELGKSVLKLVIVGAVAYITISQEMESIPGLGAMEPPAITLYMLKSFFNLFVRCALAMILIVIADYAFQRYQFEKRIKMTKQEVKDEQKKEEGDPIVKARIRGIQMQMARKRMMQAVPEADVVITNPTHLAVALKYESASMGAPRVLAKGAGAVAERIKAIAGDHRIPVVENKPLARSLFALVEIGQEIPPDLYQAVAEILAFIYKAKGNLASALGSN